MRLRESETEAERRSLHSGSERESREEVARIGSHVAACAVVVAQTDVELVGGQQFHAEGEVAEEVAHERVFLHESRGGGVLVLAVHVGEFPAAQVGGSQ